MKKPFIHPLLFAIFPILFLSSQNIGRVSFSDVLVPSAVVLGATTLLILLLRALFRDDDKTGILVSVFLALFFSYGHAFDVIRNVRIGRVVLDNHVYLMVIWCEVLASSIYFIAKTDRNLQNLTNVANIVAVSLVAMSLSNIGIHVLTTRDGQEYGRGSREGGAESSATDLGDDVTLPDIYYVILDGYASLSTLEEIYGYDNHDFVDHLATRGFFVASDSRSNYPTTYHSLASSLNMEYINHIADIVGVESKDLTALSQMIEDNNAVSFLKSKGYTFVHLSSGWGATESSRLADYSDADLGVECGAWGGMWDEFTTVLVQTTMLRPFSGYLLGGDARAQILCAFSELAQVHRIEGPKFVFAHILSPHPPFLFGANGELVPDAILNLDGYVWEQKENYINQLVFINKKVEVLIDEILSGCESPPVIVLQADHGSASTFGSTDGVRWERATEDMLRERFRIFNAYYLPYGGDSLLYDSITPVNTFRVVFNTYFGTNYELLDDRSYHVTQGRPYVFTDVTEQVEYQR